MAEAATKLTVKSEQKPEGKEGRVPAPTQLHPFASLRREIDRLFDEWGSWRLPSPRSLFDVEPFWRGETGWGKTPAVDIAETDKPKSVSWRM